MTTDEIFANAPQTLMDKPETDEEYLNIDWKSRVITLPDTLTNIGVYNDKDTNRLYFRCPVEYGEFQIADFGIHVNYQNTGRSSTKHDGDVYFVDDVESDGDYLTFSWLVGRHAYLEQGTTAFIVCCKVIDSDNNVVNELNTTIATLSVLEGLEVQPSAEEYPDYIKELLKSVDEAMEKADSAKGDADAAKESAEAAEQAAGEALEKVTEVAEQTAEMNAQIKQNADDIASLNDDLAYNSGSPTNLSSLLVDVDGFTFGGTKEMYALKRCGFVTLWINANGQCKQTGSEIELFTVPEEFRPFRVTRTVITSQTGKPYMIAISSGTFRIYLDTSYSVDTSNTFIFRCTWVFPAANS